MRTASIDATGPEWLGAYWTLEASTGAIEAAPVIFADLSLVLATFTGTSGADNFAGENTAADLVNFGLSWMLVDAGGVAFWLHDGGTMGQNARLVIARDQSDALTMDPDRQFEAVRRSLARLGVRTGGPDRQRPVSSASQAPDNPPHNLPRQLTRFVGREQERAQV